MRKKKNKVEFNYDYLKNLDNEELNKRESILRNQRKNQISKLFNLKFKLEIRIMLTVFAALNILSIGMFFINPVFAVFFKKFVFFIESINLIFGFVTGQVISDDDEAASKFSSEYNANYSELKRIEQEIIELCRTRDRKKFWGFHFDTENSYQTSENEDLVEIKDEKPIEQQNEIGFQKIYKK